MEIIVALLLIFVGFREYLAYKERKDMLDRLMAKDLPEYKAETVEEEEVKPEPITEVDFDEAREEIEDEEN